jgi:hypothetical protein
MSEDAFHRDDPTGVLLPCAINYSHAAAADFLQDFVVTETPLHVGHIVFYEDTLERFTRAFPFGFKSLAQKTIDACFVIELDCGAALRALRRMLDYVRQEIGGPSWFVH